MPRALGVWSAVLAPIAVADEHAAAMLDALVHCAFGALGGGVGDSAVLPPIAAAATLEAQIATAALVLTFDKHAKGEVASPGGYLRGMIEKAGAGELHLERSFYGRLSGQAA